MPKASRNTKGFALVEILIIVVVLLVVGAVGVYAYHHSQSTKKTSSSSSASSKSSTQTGKSNTTATDPYAGWKTETLAGTGLMFKHPEGWVVQDMAECDGAHNYTVDAPSSDVQQSGLAGVSHYGLAITVNAEVSGTSKCAPSASSLSGVVLGSQSQSALVSDGALKGKYVVVNGGSDGTSGVDVLGSSYGPGQKISETGVLSISGVNLQITASLSSGQNPALANTASFLNSQLYKDTAKILNSFAGN